VDEPLFSGVRKSDTLLQPQAEDLYKMKRLVKILGLALLGLTLAACSDQAPDGSQSAPAEQGVAALQSGHKTGSVVLNLEADDSHILTVVGQRVAGQGLVANGQGGYLAYGPYAGLDAGTYTFTLFGTITAPAPENAVVVDVVHGQGKIEDAKVIFDRGAGQEGGRPVLTKLGFTLKQPVDDAEFRVLVQPGTHVAMTGYQVMVGR
jgi:hypothetical protein